MQKRLMVKYPSFEGFFKDIIGNNTLKIPPYQRPYVWDKSKIIQLLDDWIESLDNDDKASRYFMGSIIMHHDESSNVFNIVDGQQRMTTLLVIDYIFHKDNSVLIRYKKQIDFHFSSHESVDNIGANVKTLRTLCKKGKYARLENSGIFNKLVFTVIITDSEDEAFTFFDSQNNRGVQPQAVDVMKAVHLRAIKHDDCLRKDCAQLWESIQNANNVFNIGSDDYLSTLVQMLLWRLRRWKGNWFDNISNYKSAMEEFADELKSTKDNIIHFYGLANSANMTIRNELQPNDLQINDKDSVNNKKFPFVIRQPLLKGVSTFAYIETYHEIVQKLFGYEEETDSEIIRMRELYNQLYIDTGMSRYMTDYFIMCMTAYYDKFLTNQLYNFALAVDYIVGMHRVNYFYFQDVSMRNFSKDHNIFDVIQTSFEPDEVIKFILAIQPEKREVNKNGPIDKYTRACLSYFRRSLKGAEDIRDFKLEWTKELIYGNE